MWGYAFVFSIGAPPRAPRSPPRANGWKPLKTYIYIYVFKQLQQLQHITTHYNTLLHTVIQPTGTHRQNRNSVKTTILKSGRRGPGPCQVFRKSCSGHFLNVEVFL